MNGRSSYLLINPAGVIKSSMPLPASKTEVRGQRSAVEKGKLMQIRSAKELRVYKRAYALAMEIFEISRRWPVEERYSLKGV
jgi:hypothetical protein